MWVRTHPLTLTHFFERSRRLFAKKTLATRVPGRPLFRYTYAEFAERTWTRDDALLEIVRSRLEGLGPTTTAAIADSMRLPGSDIEAALAERDAVIVDLETTGMSAPHDGQTRGEPSTGVLQEGQFMRSKMVAQVGPDAH